jgi:hypothetical protein
MARDNSPQWSKEVDGPPAAQRRQTGDRAFTESGRQLHTGDISMGSLHTRHVLPRAQAGPSGLRVEWAEEQALVHVAAADVEGRTNVLLHQLDDADHRGVGEFSSLLFSSFFIYISPLIVNGIMRVRGDHGAGGSSHRGRRLPG